MKILFILSLIILSYKLDAQNLNNIYSDVIQLKKTYKVVDGVGTFKNDTSFQKIYLQILAKYFEPGKKDSLTGLKNLIKASNNPFEIDAMFPEPQESLDNFIDAATSQNFVVNPSAGNAVNSSTGLNAPALVSALTSLIIKRAKEELTVAFFDKLKSELAKHSELVILFPKTADFINNIESYLYASFLNPLRQAFANDLANLPSNLPSFLRTGEVKNFILKNPRYSKIWLTIPAFDFIGKILKGSSVADAIKSLNPDLEAIKDSSLNLYSSLQLICIFSESLRDITGKKDWIEWDNFNANIIEDKTAEKLFFGLLYQEVKNINFTGADKNLISLSSIIIPTNLENAESALQDLIAGYDDVVNNITLLKNAKRQGDSVTFKQTLALINDAADNCKNAITSINGLITGTNSDFLSKADTVFNSIPELTEMIGNIYNKEYIAAVTNSVIFISHFLRNDQSLMAQEFLKYGSLMASLAEAKTAEDVEVALNAAILPVGSSSIKQNTSFSVALNTYIGADFYFEKYSTGVSGTSHIKIPTFGVGLPVGVTLSKGFHWKKIGSLSLFISVIDLGAIASYQLSTPDSVQSKQLPNFTWQNLLAPGGYLVIGRLFNTPLAIGFGAQKGPALRDITYTPAGGVAIDLSNKINMRYGVFLAVDIPLFNLYSKAYQNPLTK